MACPRIVGLDVSPVTARSRTYRASVPVRSMTRLMLSSHRLCPSVCSRCAGFSLAAMPTPRSASTAIFAQSRPHVQAAGGPAGSILTGTTG